MIKWFEREILCNCYPTWCIYLCKWLITQEILLEFYKFHCWNLRSRKSLKIKNWISSSINDKSHESMQKQLKTSFQVETEV